MDAAEAERQEAFENLVQAMDEYAVDGVIRRYHIKQAFANAGEKINDFKIEKTLEMSPGDGDGNPYIFEFAKIYFNFILKMRFKYCEKFKRKKLEITLTDPSK